MGDGHDAHCRLPATPQEESRDENKQRQYRQDSLQQIDPFA